jgi:hypothetical protein
MFLSKLIGPAFIDHPHHFVALTRIDLVPPDAHEHSSASWFVMSISMR